MEPNYKEIVSLVQKRFEEEEAAALAYHVKHKQNSGAYMDFLMARGNLYWLNETIKTHTPSE